MMTHNISGTCLSFEGENYSIESFIEWEKRISCNSQAVWVQSDMLPI